MSTSPAAVLVKASQPSPATAAPGSKYGTGVHADSSTASIKTRIRPIVRAPRENPTPSLRHGEHVVEGGAGVGAQHDRPVDTGLPHP